MPQIVNWEILANPLNWVIVALMLAIAVFGLSLISGAQSPATGL
jgi:hypothetical protein